MNFGIKKSGGENFSDTEFRRVISVKHTVTDEETGTETEAIHKAIRIMTSGTGTGQKRKNYVTLVPMRSLSLEPFAFPFSNTTKIREALRLQVLPFSAAGELELFPVVLNRTGRGANGLVWYASPDELNIPAYEAGNGKVWPAPLPFVSQLGTWGGNGVTMWRDEENICSLLWQENKPVLYRWRKLIDAGSEDKELAWYDSYCTARELNRGGNFVVNATGGNDDEASAEFAAIVAESVKVCPWISDVNLSRIVRLLTRAACWLLVLGGVALGTGVLRWRQVQGQIQEVRTRSENYYRQVFDPQRTGRISNPVVLARDKIAEVSGTGGPSHPLEDVLADLGEIFGAEQNKAVNLDVIRYNSEGIDCTGTAPDMTTVLNFRKAWEDMGNMAQVDNTQFVSGIGYRFDLRVRWQ